MDEIGLNELLQLIIKEKGGTPKQYNKLMDYIAYHETGPSQRMSTSAKQEGGGPGRGLFQFETGNDKGGNTAVNRTYNYLKRNNLSVPKWLNKMWEGKKSADVSTLNADQQKMLFLGYHREHPTSNFSNVWSGKQTVDNFWLNNHWAGDASESATKLDLFKKSMLAKDSTDALKVRKAELFGKDDKVPFQSAQNDPNRLPTESDILKSIFGQQTSAIVQGFEKGYKFAASGGKGSESHRKSLETDFGKGWEYAITGGNPGKFVDGKYQEGTKDNWLKKLFSDDKYDHGGVHLPGDEDKKGTPTISTINAVELLKYYKDKVKKTIGITNNKKKETDNGFEELRGYFPQEEAPTADQIRRLREDYERKHGTKRNIFNPDINRYQKMIWDTSVIEDKMGRKILGDWVPEPEEVEIKATTPKKVDSKKRKLEELIKLPSRSISLIPKEEVRLEKAGIDIDQSKYTYSKYYDPKRREYRVRVIDKSRRGKSDSEVDNLSLDMFKEFYRYKR